MLKVLYWTIINIKRVIFNFFLCNIKLMLGNQGFEFTKNMVWLYDWMIIVVDFDGKMQLKRCNVNDLNRQKFWILQLMALIF